MSKRKKKGGTATVDPPKKGKSKRQKAKEAQQRAEAADAAKKRIRNSKHLSEGEFRRLMQQARQK